MKTLRSTLGVVVLIMGLVVMGCATAPTTESERAVLITRAEQARELAKSSDPSITDLMANAAGYAIFPTVGKGAIGVGGAYGRGVLYEHGAVVGFCDLTQGTIGVQLGGQKYTELIVFEDTLTLERFKSGNFAFAAQATAVALRSGVGANAKYTDGVAVFTMDEGGLMYEASIGGQKFSYMPR